LVYIFFSFLNRTGSVRVSWFRYTKTGNRTEPDIFLNILTGSIDFFYRFGFFGYFFSGFLGQIDFPVFLLTPSHSYDFEQVAIIYWLLGSAGHHVTKRFKILLSFTHVVILVLSHKFVLKKKTEIFNYNL